jgi:hypothetical protein
MAISGALGSQIIEKLSTEFLPINSNTNHSSSKIKIPPRIYVEGSDYELNLVRFTLEQFQKNDITESFFGLEFLQPLLNVERSNLELFAVVASLQCWFDIIQKNEHLTEEIWKVNFFNQRVFVLYFLCKEFHKRPAMKKHQLFLIQIIQFHLAESDKRNILTDSKQCLSLKNFLVQFK